MAAAPAATTTRRSALHRWIASRDAALAALNVVLAVAVALRFPDFVAPSNLADILDDTAILFLLALAQMCVILTGAIDLSVAANLALTGVTVALVNAAHPGLGVAPIIVLALVMGAALGAFNAVLVWKLRLPSIVVTLGTLAVYRGCIFLITGGAWVNSNQMSDAFLGFIRVPFLGLTLLTWIALAGIAAATWFLNFTVAGRNLYVAGGNRSAAFYAGIDPWRMQALAFVISGAVAGLCGYFWVSRFAVAYVEVAQGFELQAIAACVIGGVSIAGGLGTVAGVVLGALFLGLVKNALPLIGISPFWQMAIAGAVITVAVIVNARGDGRAAGRRILEEKAA
ncbi:ABC transporter permease [Segnochrobactrum spirostomi]|uniref:Autoinducer 2 import system permease protein LsrC n=1 Tax=Segnochrobactrum spirostomi TaxID=2608987 RepID=A0A6A7Y1N1_9HYPH|nr:ABC transporter permease [Segnochrobactrum spirostomi]MQT12596.1 ABC transporter permease [Segnochrobactrum spirostomi]